MPTNLDRLWCRLEAQRTLYIHVSTTVFRHCRGNSDFERVPGKNTIPASKNANHIPGPITTAANEGNTNNRTIDAATVTITTFKPRVLSMVYLTSETTPEILPLNNLSVVDLMPLKSLLVTMTSSDN